MGILSWIIFGLIAGALAKFIMPGRDPGGCIVTCILGIVGAVVGGWVGTLMGLGKANLWDLRSFGLAIVGAIVVLLIYRMIAGKRTPPS
ncbi:MAG: GlsB/YeaQ/YmgE family stress response membrane protein [Verrucomicrobiales bacterium]